MPSSPSVQRRPCTAHADGGLLRLRAAVTSLTQTVGLSRLSACARQPGVAGLDGYPMLRGMLPSEEAMARTIAGLPEQFKLGIPCARSPPRRRSPIPSSSWPRDLASHITLQDLVVDGGATPECLRLEKQMNI